MTKLIDAELIIEELEKIIQLVKDADGVKVVPLVENALNITSEYLRTGKEQNIIMVKDHGKRQQKEMIEKFRQLQQGGRIMSLNVAKCHEMSRNVMRLT